MDGLNASVVSVLLHSEALSPESAVHECGSFLVVTRTAIPPASQNGSETTSNLVALESNAPRNCTAKMFEVGADARNWAEANTAVGHDTSWTLPVPYSGLELGVWAIRHTSEPWVFRLPISSSSVNI